MIFRRHTGLALGLCFSVLSGAALAGLDEGLAAYGKGDYATAVQEFKPLAVQGNALAQFKLGVLYQYGQGVAQDYQEAVKWYRLAAGQGNDLAQLNLGVMYSNGRGVAQDYQEAVKWFRLAAGQGDAKAQFSLGVLYNSGQGVAQDYQEAVKWFRLAAAQGDAKAQFNLGLLYNRGQGVAQDYQEAVKWYRLAAAQGDAKAQFNLDAIPPQHFLLRLSGSNTIGAKLAPALVKSWLSSIGATDIGVVQKKSNGIFVPEVIVSAVLNNDPVKIEIRSHGSEFSFKDLKERSADIGMASRKIKSAEIEDMKEFGEMDRRASEHVLALDGIAVIVPQSNTLDSITKKQLTSIFCGNTANWSDMKIGYGGINLYIRDGNSGTYDTFKNLVCGEKPILASAKKFEDSAELEAAVARDPNGIGFIGLPYIKTTKSLAVADSQTSLPFAPTTLTIKKEDYPLSRRLYLYTPASTENTYSSQFVSYALSPAGQAVAKNIGFIDLTIKLSESGDYSPQRNAACQLSSSWPYKNKFKYCDIKGKLRILPTIFKFKSGSSELDNRAWQDITRVLNALSEQHHKITLIGFADARGDYSANMRLAEDRARTVQNALRTVGLDDIDTIGFGQELPVRDNDSESGRLENRRVEVWIH